MNYAAAQHAMLAKRAVLCQRKPGTICKIRNSTRASKTITKKPTNKAFVCFESFVVSVFGFGCFDFFATVL